MSVVINMIYIIINSRIIKKVNLFTINNIFFRKKITKSKHIFIE